MNIHLYLHHEMRVRDENKEAAIRDKAMEMIVKGGFEALSMQKLARAANISPATIYIYYRNREDLLHQLYHHSQEKFAEFALRGFSPDVSLEEGLWVQWKNRMEFIMDYPIYYRFFEQFRNSPLINNTNVKMAYFRENMMMFTKNAMRRGELKKMDPELFWAIAYGTLYSLVRFHLQERKMMSENFRLTDAKLRQALKMVVKALKPD